MSRRWPIGLVVVVAVAACAGPAASSSAAASDGVRAYLAALQSNNPADAYKLLSDAAKQKMSFEEFSLQWRQTTAERDWQVHALEASVKGNPDVGERALFSYSDGKRVELDREGKSWRLESELVSRSRAKEPRDAIRLFADAISARDINAIMNVLSQRRRDALQKQVEGFVAGVVKRINDRVDQIAPDRAEMRWDENGLRYRIVLRKEDDEWRVDEIYVRPAPKEEEDKGGTEGTTIPDDF
jgi:hypothetical protein